MTRADIEDKVMEILSGELSVDRGEIHAASGLVEDLGIDSFGLVEIMYRFEEAFDMTIPDADLGSIKTVKDVVDYVERRGVKA